MASRIKQNPESTFEVYMEVVHPGALSSGPEVRRQFPQDFSDQETLQTVPKFCFPFNMDSLTVNQVGQNFTFVLTDIESKHRFGFCRLSLGAHTCYCILSYLPWFEVFYKLLNILADHTIKGQESHVQELLVTLHTLPIPEPGVPVHLGVHSFVSVPDLRDLPSIPENRNLTEYFVAVDVNNMLHLFASMLYERRILICCSKLSTLTACVHGSAAMLYPMHWQHVYIPVLPQHLLDYCCAPMPYLIGVHSSLMEKVRGMALDDVVVLNVDTNTLESPYEDLQSLPNDVVSNLKSRLRRVSSATGDGVARAFLKTQAALFGSYRNALQIDSGELITFNEETFMNHRSSAMRVFLQNAIQLQLFKQFIDGRLDLLNSGEGFSDIFEEEINMGEYAGSEKAYHQWLFTVKKGGGAIFNTVKTKANPAMKTVYKFAKDHAKMGIKEVKSRLKQKESTENGFSGSGSGSVVIDEHGSEGFASTAGAPLRREGPLRIWDDHRPITVHFGQTRPPILLKRPSSNLSLESSNDQPQPYRSLKEVDLLEGGEPDVGAESHTAPPSPITEKFSNVSLLRDVFGCQDEPDCQMTLAKSLEDLRTPKDSVELQAKFKYQHLDLNISEHPPSLPGHKLFSSHNKSRSAGRETSHPDAPRDGLPSLQLPGRADLLLPGCEGGSPGAEPPDASAPGNITIPRPHGRKTPELGSILSPPVAQTRSKLAASAEGGAPTGGQKFRQVLSMAAGEELLKPIRASDHHVDLLSLLDPLSANTGSPPEANGGAAAEPHRPRPQGSPPSALHPQVSLNPFTSPHMQYPSAASENPFGALLYGGGGPFLDAAPPPQSYFPAAGPYAQRFPLLTAGGRVAPPPAAASLPRTSASNHSLSGVMESASASAAVTLPPFHLGGHAQKPEDPFGDLLTLAKPAPPPKPKVDDLRRRWETFD